MADLPVPANDPETVRQVTESVLRRPEFLEARPSWWRQGLRWIVDQVADLLDLLSGGGRGSTIGTFVLVILCLVAIVVIVRFTRSVRRDPSQSVIVEGGYGRTPQDWLDDARDHEAAGRWRDALRCRYRALVAELAAEGFVEEVPGRTTGEYLAAVTDDLPTAAEPFRVTTRAFESAWYGSQDVGPADAERFATAAAAVLSAAGVRRREHAGAP